jgi:hypothetical protein
MGMNPMGLLFTLCIAGAIVIFLVLATRYNARELEHKEILAALEKGVDVPMRATAPWTPRTYLLHGMIWLFAGISTFVALSAIAATSREVVPMAVRTAEVNNARAGGATPEEIQILLHSPREEEGLPIGLGFIGLIPCGVGIAYLIFYRIESKKLLN